MKVFIDSNIPMYVAGTSHPNREPARRFLERVRDGDVEGSTSTEVLQEILYRYANLHDRKRGAHVYDLFVEICPSVLPVTLRDTDRAKELLISQPKLSARDAVHAAVMLSNGITQIATFDRGFDELPGIKRIALR